jgi:hypothetical protein
MKMIIILLSVLILNLAAILIYINRTEKYEIAYSVLVTNENGNIKLPPGAICYSKNELHDLLPDEINPQIAKLFAFNLDSDDFFACVVEKRTVEKVVGRGNLGFIILNSNIVDGTCISVIKGNKGRFFQFYYPNDLGSKK